MRVLLAALPLVLLACAGLPPWTRSAPREVALVPSAALPPPTAVRARSGELRRIPLTWKPTRAPEVAGYVVERARADGDAFSRVGRVDDRFTTWFVDRLSLADDTAMRYRVRAFDARGALGLEASAEVTARTAPAPRPPAGLAATSHLPRRVVLTWQASDDPNVSAYTIHRSPAQGGPFDRIARVEGRFHTGFTDEGLGDLRVFYYRVAAVHGADDEPGVGEGPPGSVVQAVTKARPLPPVGLRVAEKRLGANRLAWEANVEEDIVGYRLLRERKDGGLELVAELGGQTHGVEDTAVAAGEAVAYRLLALDADGLESAPCQPVRVRSEGYDLSARPARGAVALRWNPRTDEGYTGARIYRLRALGRRELARVRGDRYLDTEVIRGRVYRYSVVLERADGSLAPASVVADATLPALPETATGPPPDPASEVAPESAPHATSGAGNGAAAPSPAPDSTP